ncbi:unnamed protein product [Hapterophycus canaliculatus]
MAAQAYPNAVRIAELEAEGGEFAVHEQLAVVARDHPSRTREFCRQVCAQVGALFCDHGEDPPQPLPRIRDRRERVEAARAHPGTCGVHQAGIIAGVEMEDIEKTASRRGQRPSWKTFRNQACYDAARALNAHGGGVQIPRGKCFEKACQALWPGEESIEQWAVTAFSSANVEVSTDTDRRREEVESSEEDGRAASAVGV